MRWPMAATPTTADDLLALPRGQGVRHELVRGELRTMSPAGWWHGAVAAALIEHLRAHARAFDLGVVFGCETGFVLARKPDTVRAPDAAFVAWDRIPAAPAPGFFDGPPDLAAEVVSPGDAAARLDGKCADWLAAGVRVLWIVDPLARTVAVHSPPSPVRVLDVDGVLDGAELLPGLRLRVRDLFALEP
jgi:Uma2 family endonuclease